MRGIYPFLFCFISKILFSSALGNSSHKLIEDVCPKVCQCSEKRRNVVCSNRGKKLTTVPAVPRYVQKLTLDNDFFPRLSRSTLRNLSKTHLSELRIRGSKIINVGNDTFIDLPYLKSLDFVANRHLNFTSVKFSFSSLRSGNLSVINLGRTGLVSKEMSNNLFSNLKGRTIDEVVLTYNNIRYLPEGSLRGLENLRKFTVSYNVLEECDMTLVELQNLEYLAIENNKIHKCNVSSLPLKLKKLQMNRNSLKQFPKFCLSNRPRLLMLNHINLEQNDIRSIVRSSFRCLPALRYLNLSRNKLRRFPSYVFNELQNLYALHLTDLKDTVISIKEGAFSISNLTEFHFQGNKFNFRPLAIARKASLGNNKKLKVLDMSYNKIPVSYMVIKHLLGGLLNLKELRMISVAWDKVPDSFFKMLPNLEEISLSHNSIEKLTDDLFSETSRIKLLRLRANGLSYIGPDTFPKSFWETVEILDLSGNPFACNCDLLWFRDKLREGKINFHEYPKKYVCRSPGDKKGLWLSQFDLKASDCEDNSVLITAVVSFTMCLILVSLVGLAIYRFRWQIRYFIYLWRYKEPRRPDIGEEDFSYDAFVIYPEDDSDFVHNILLNKLENENNFKICIHPRDFQPGKSIIENIVECISNSRRVLVVLSHYFSSSKWCNFELLIAQDRWLNNESSSPLLIMHEEVDYSWMKREIRALVKTTTYARWTEDNRGQELFWHQIVSSIKNC